MAVTGTEAEGTGDSLGTAIDAAVGDTSTTETHTPEQPTQEPAEDIDALLEKLEANKDKIPAERLQFLNPDLQAGFNRRLNLLNRGVEGGVKKLLDDAGVQLPPGKTVMDLLTEDDGKEFFRVMSESQQRTLKPVMDHVEQQRESAQIAEWSGFAKREFPLVAENFDEVAKRLASNPDLAVLAKTGDWRGLPLVMQGLAYQVANEKLTKDLTEARKLLNKTKVASTVGRTTSRAGGPAPTAGAEGKMNLTKALDAAFAKIKEEGASN